MATSVGVMHLELQVPQAMSLKDKRRFVKGFKDRVKHRFNVSIAEVGNLESCRRATLAVAMVGNDRRFVEGVLQQVENLAALHRDMILEDRTIQWL